MCLESLERLLKRSLSNMITLGSQGSDQVRTHAHVIGSALREGVSMNKSGQSVLFKSFSANLFLVQNYRYGKALRLERFSHG